MGIRVRNAESSKLIGEVILLGSTAKVAGYEVFLEDSDLNTYATIRVEEAQHL